MRRTTLVIGGIAVVAGVAVPALAADQEVTAAGQTFSPKTVTVGVGETVTFKNASGFHNVRFAGEAALSSPTSNPALGAKTFPAAGTFKFFCEQHASGPDDAGGMTGTVVVETEAEPSPSATATPTPVPTVNPVALPFTASVRERPFCVKRSKQCRKPGVKIKLRSSGTFPVDATVKRGRTTLGELAFDTERGRSTFVFKRVDGMRLKPGSYTVTLTSEGFPGSKRLAFTVR